MCAAVEGSVSQSGRSRHRRRTAVAGASRGTTPGACTRALAARSARAVYELSALEGVGNAGRRCTRSRACSVVSTRVSHHRSTGTTRHSRTQWFYGLFRALPGDRALLPPSSLRSLLLKNLNASVGAPGPHDFAVRDDRRSSLAVSRVHRIPPQRFVTCATPLIGRDARIDITDLPDDGSGIFLREGMDRILVICPSGYFVAGGEGGFDLRVRRCSSQRRRETRSPHERSDMRVNDPGGFHIHRQTSTGIFE
jgi:hypothetical protein